MEFAPIRSGAESPRGRSPRALIPALVRCVALAGFVFAGWLALAALNPAAHADGKPAGKPAPQAPAEDAPGRLRPAALGHLASGVRAGDPVAGATREVREIGDRPARYLRIRGHELLRDGDRAVRHVRGLAGAAGLPDARIAGRPVVGGLVDRVTVPRSVPRSVPHDGLRPDAAAAHPAAVAETDRPKDVRREAATPGSGSRHRAAADGAAAASTPGAAGRKAAGCDRCGAGDRVHEPGPALPSGQDGPRSGGSGGGQPFSPIADLPARPRPAARPAAEGGAFGHTALTDVAAPGRPAVAPD